MAAHAKGNPGCPLADVLLTHSYHLPFDAKQVRKMQPYPPIGTLYAATALREHGVSVTVFDTMLEPPGEQFLRKLRELHPKIVAVYEDDFNFLSKMCLTRMREVAQDIAKAASEIGAKVIVHGSDATDNPRLFLENGFDYVLCGEAEDTLVRLCSAILQNFPIPELDGLIWLDDQGQILRSQHPLAKNPEWMNLPSPARDLIDLAPYRTAWREAHGYFSTNMVASRGCPFRCNWCAKPISGNRFHLRSASAVAEEMALLKHAGVEHLWFGDDIFALNHHWVQEFAEEVTKRDAAIPFKVQSRADLMRSDTVHYLKTAGCAEVWMGVESGSQNILDAMDKGITLDQIEAARQRLRNANIRACFFLQFGYPGETWIELQQTVALVRKLRPDDVGISFSYPLPGTAFYEHVQSQLGTKRNWNDSDDLCIMFNAAYTTEFYRAIRDALHAEVETWSSSNPNELRAHVESLWSIVYEMEPQSRTPEAFAFSEQLHLPRSSSIVSVEQLTSSGKI